MLLSLHYKNLLKATTIGLIGLTLVSGPAPTMAAESDAYSIARGGRLYDKWFKESKEEAVKTPEVAHPSYPDEGKYKANKAADWRCKECHGWDYLGAEGAYSGGKHYTGIKGIAGMADADLEAITAVLKDETHALGQSGLSDKDYHDLAMFVSKGQIKSDGFIDSETKQVKGDVDQGQAYYETVCANCHGFDGKADDEIPPMGKLSNDNPWEVLHKVAYGQPNEEMPALHAFEIEVSADIVTYLQTLPKE